MGRRDEATAAEQARWSLSKLADLVQPPRIAFPAAAPLRRRRRELQGHFQLLRPRLQTYPRMLLHRDVVVDFELSAPAAPFEGPLHHEIVRTHITLVRRIGRRVSAGCCDAVFGALYDS